MKIGLKDQDALLGRAGIKSSPPESTKRLKAARRQLQKLLTIDLDAYATADAKLARLQEWADFLRSSAYVVVLHVPIKDAHNIFETLNSRGVRLSNGDLVKSHLIGRASDYAMAVAKWDQITAALTDAAGSYESDLESFLLHYYGSRYAKTTNANLFFDFREQVGSQAPTTTLDDLLESASIYRALVDPAASKAFWDAVGAGAQQAVELLNGLGLKQVRYLLLAIIRDFAKSDNAASRRKKQREAILKTASWSIRALVHHKLGGGEAERTFIAGAAAIRNDKKPVNTVTQLRNVFDARGVLMSDGELFKQAFMEFSFDNRTNHTRARAVLYGLEYGLASDKAGMRPREDLTVEHVLPQSPNDGEWKEFTDEEKRAFPHNLGNLLLVHGPSLANDALGNSEWPKKKALLATWPGQTQLTVEAMQYGEWTKSTIEARLTRLAELAETTWPV